MNPVTILQASDVRSVPTPAHGPAGMPMKWMWGAIAALGACVVALATTLVVQAQAPAPAATASSAAVVPSSQGAPAQPLGLMPAQPGALQAPRASERMPEPFQPQRADLVGGTAQMVQRAPVCGNCGRIESVQAVQQAEPASGVGAVAGGVLGAVVGNQIGKGSGRTAATVLGAVGGGYVGHQVEQRTRTRTVYQVAVRMDDGSLRRFTRTQPPAVGTPVALQGKGYRIDHERDSRPNGAGAYTNNAPASAVRVANGY